MATLTIPFPEGTRTIALRGNRITIGRLPDNTVQVRDRTVSAYHAELILEGDHYRLHDLGATNGVVVNGQVVKDFHLHEDCKVNLGGVACDFSAAPESATNSEEAKPLPTHSEMQNIVRVNDELRSQVSALRDQVEAMKKARENTGDAAQGVSLEKYDQLAAEITELHANLQERQTQLDRMTSLLAIANRERETLQRSYDEARAALEAAKAQGAPAQLATAKVAAPTPPDPIAGRVPAVPAPTDARPSAPAPAGAPAGPKPSIPVSPKPALPKPPGTLAGSGSPSRRPASGTQMPPAKAPAARSGASLAGASSTGPKGTQKLGD